MRLPRFAFSTCCLLLLTSSVLCLQRRGWAQASPPPSPANPVADKSSAQGPDYVGSETCKTCHEDIFKNFETTPHFKTTLTKKGPQWQGCEACHGPGKAHVESGGDKSKIFVFTGAKPEDVSKRGL